MIGPSEIKIKAERKYLSFLQSIIEDRSFEKLEIRGDKTYTKTSFSDFEKEVLLLMSQSKAKNGVGYTLEFQKVKTKYLGTQDLPTAIYFETEADFLAYLDKKNEVEIFRLNVEKIAFAFPELNNWILQNPLKIILNQAHWEGILKVCQYFKQHPKPHLYIRELPIKVHTKFVEQNKGILKDLLEILISEHLNAEEKGFEQRFNLKYAEPQIRFKVLDKAISDYFFGGLDDLAIPISQFENLKLPLQKVVIVENKTTLYTTLTLPNMHNAIAVFGSGYRVYELKNVAWFADCELLYWGDMDVQGFEILAYFRKYHSHTKSVLMEKQTFERFFENDLGTPTHIGFSPNLTDSEQDLYELLKTNNWRLEQEKIPFEYVNQYFDSIE